MEILVEQLNLTTADADALVVGVFQGTADEINASSSLVDEALNGAIGELLSSGDLKGKLGETAVLYPRGAIPSRRVIVVGLGEREKLSLEHIREAAAVAIKQAHKSGTINVSVVFDAAMMGEFETQEAAQAVIEGSLLALYKYDAPIKKREESEINNIESIKLLITNEAHRREIDAGARTGQAIAEGIYLARNLVNQPSNIATPTAIAEAARAMCSDVGLSCRILDEGQIRDEKMGLLLAVNQGSTQPPQFIVMEHKPSTTSKTSASGPIVLIGKGVSFDTGGYSLKPQAGMVGMKGDMSGAAAVIGAMRAIGQLNLPLHVVGLVPSVENMISASAFKPNDVFVGKNGVSVEVINTDAEGRLILADALCYADSLNPSAVIDVATLTGAKKIALGPRINALFVNDDALNAQLLRAGEAVNEPLWRMPIDPAYDAQLKSSVADIKNDGGPDAASITAARFLAKFVGDWPWAHIDIAGSQYYADGPEQTSRSYMTSGASGTPARALIEYLRNQCKES